MYKIFDDFILDGIHEFLNMRDGDMEIIKSIDSRVVDGSTNTCSDGDDGGGYPPCCWVAFSEQAYLVCFLFMASCGK